MTQGTLVMVKIGMTARDRPWYFGEHDGGIRGMATSDSYNTVMWTSIVFVTVAGNNADTKVVIPTNSPFI